MAEIPIVSARVLDLGFGQFELKKWLAKTEIPAETETLAERFETVRNCSKLLVRNCLKLFETGRNCLKLFKTS